jgi:hypothetical protein
MSPEDTTCCEGAAAEASEAARARLAGYRAEALCMLGQPDAAVAVIQRAIDACSASNVRSSSALVRRCVMLRC